MRTSTGTFGLCPRCGRCCWLTRHHVYPQRFFNGYGPILWLCRSCHDELEKEIPAYVKLEKRRYVEIAYDFIKEVSYAEPRTV